MVPIKETVWIECKEIRNNITDENEKRINNTEEKLRTLKTSWTTSLKI